MHAREDLALRATGIHYRDRAALRMTLLPLGGGESPEFRGDAGVEIRRCLLDAVVCAAPSDTLESYVRGKIEQHREIGREPAGRHPIRRDQVMVWYAPARSLIRVRREKKAVDKDD